VRGGLWRAARRETLGRLPPGAGGGALWPPPPLKIPDQPNAPTAAGDATTSVCRPDPSPLAPAAPRPRRRWFHSLQERVMRQDWSWNRPATDYIELYHSAMKA
jgi:hypothetical protein